MGDPAVLEGIGMMRKILLATVCVVGLSAAGAFSGAYAATEATTTDAQQAALDAQVAAIEALVIQYQNDPAGLQAAIESLVVNAADPETSGKAVLIVFDNSQNPAIKTLLANNAALASAGGQGLGAAVAQIGLSNPDLATRMAANVSASGSSSFVASVQTGDNTRTASIQQGQQNANGNATPRSYSSTPEQPASGS